MLYPISLTRTTRPGGRCGYSDRLMWRTWEYISDLIVSKMNLERESERDNEKEREREKVTEREKEREM